jgi:hypothetical protein
MILSNTQNPNEFAKLKECVEKFLKLNCIQYLSMFSFSSNIDIVLRSLRSLHPTTQHPQPRM